MGQKYKLNEKTGMYSTLIWDGTYDAKGRKHRKQITSKKSSADLEKKVYDFKRQVEKNIEKHGTTKSPKYTFGEYYNKWIEQKGKSLSAHSLDRYYRNLNYFSPIYGIYLDEITRYDVQQIINDNFDKPPTCKLLIGTFKQIIKSAVIEHILPSSALFDLCEGITIPKKKRTEKRALYDFEKKSLFEVPNFTEQEQCFVMLLYFCGIRKSEALALNTSDFDWKTNTVKITKNLTILKGVSEIKDSPKSDNGYRTIPIPEEGIKYIKGYVESQTGTIFKSIRGETFSGSDYAKLWYRIKTKMNRVSEEPIVGLTAHIFRHNYCTELCYQVPRISTKMIAKLLGDNESMVLNVYSHIMEEKEDTISVLNDIFSNN